MNNLTPSPEYQALRNQAIKDLSKSTVYLLEEEEVRERMIESWISGYYSGSINGYNKGRETSWTQLTAWLSTINSKP